MPEDAVGREWKGTPAAGAGGSAEEDDFWAFNRLCEIAKFNGVVSPLPSYMSSYSLRWTLTKGSTCR